MSARQAALPEGVRSLLDAPNFVHLSTLRANASPRNWVVWVRLEDDRVLVCTDDRDWKAKDMRRNARVALSVIDSENPYRMVCLTLIRYARRRSVCAGRSLQEVPWVADRQERKTQRLKQWRGKRPMKRARSGASPEKLADGRRRDRR